MKYELNGADLPEIIKRLKLIENLIPLEEEKRIGEQITKLQFLQLDQPVHKIIVALQQKTYGRALKEIEAFVNYHHLICLYIDPELEALRFQAKALEAELQRLSDDKAELEKLIHEFGIRHNQELGELILKILKLRKKKNKGSPQEKSSEKDYDDFNKNYEATKNKKIVDLTEEQKKELKDIYRKASKLCHPDMVDNSQNEMAQKIFIDLNTAYESNDLRRVTEILHNLQQGKTFSTKLESANEKLTLELELNRLISLINDLIQTIEIIKASETYTAIKAIANWDEYFIKTKRELQEQLNEMEYGGE